MNLNEIISEIEKNSKIEILRNGKVSFRNIGGKRYLLIKTPIGTREFRNADQIKGARLLLHIISEVSKETDLLLHTKGTEDIMFSKS